MTTKVLFAIAEMAPLIKVGGLADVGMALPKALRQAGIDVRVALPFYESITARDAEKVGDATEEGALWQTTVEGVPVYLVEHSPSFDRPEPYGYDDTERFLAFTDVLVAGAGLMDWRPDILHLNDWHPGFIASRVAATRDHLWSASGRVATIHNLAFTGPFDRKFAEHHDIEADEQTLSALGQSVALADIVTTVSPTYADEIRRDEHGHGLGALLQAKGDRFRGILNGLDLDQFDPATDRHLAATFTSETIGDRSKNKIALQKRLGLAVREDVPLIGMVTRLFWQKGIDLAAEALDQLLAEREVQVVILGQGDEENIDAVRKLARRYPDSVVDRFAFDEPLGQLIYGGCDIFFMPSRYEPCGVGQMVAMRYGAVPVVRKTGGLADSVTPFDGEQDAGSGFLFDKPEVGDARRALERALDVFGDQKVWRALQRRAMHEDFSWERAAQTYADVYADARAIHKGTARVIHS